MSRPLLNFGGDSTEQKWQSWLEVVSGELTEADAARKLGVVVSVIIKLRKVAKDACLSAFAALPPSTAVSSRSLSSHRWSTS